jgi:predicted amidophosphoribosyltransferase
MNISRGDAIVLVFLGLAVLFGLLMLAFVLILMRREPGDARCPFCAERIKKTATLCRHCGRELA